MRLIVERRGEIAYWILSGDGPVLTLDRGILLDLAAAVQTVGDARGVVLCSDRDDHFCAGADIDLLESIGTADEGTRLAREGQAVLDAIEDLPIPVVAAISGACLGGGLELALACHARVAVEGARLGLPEVQVGVIPGLGGITRLPRLVGLKRALPLLLSGRATRPRGVPGLVDAVVPIHSLMRAAERLVREPPRRKRRRTLLAPLYKAVAKRKIPPGFRAPRRVLDALGGDGAEEFGQAIASEESQHLLEIFRAASACKRGALDPLPRFAGVLGFGAMGAGIASALTRAGVFVRVRDTDDDAIRRGLKRFDGDRSKLMLTTGWEGFCAAEVVIEAVPEDLELKEQVLARAARAAPDALLMTNTSSLSVNRLGVVGMHFFNPVRRMPLVEVVAGPRTPPAAVRKARSLAVALKKVPVVVRDVPGFLVNRILVRYLAAALSLDESVDGSARAYGFPMGPYEVVRLVGEGVAETVLGQLRDAYGERYETRVASFEEALAALRDEANRCRTEQVADESQIELACVMGFGYPAWRGSVLVPGAARARKRRAG